MYCIFKTRCIITVLSTKYSLLHKFIFFCSDNTHFKHNVLKFCIPTQLFKGYKSYQDAVASYCV